MSEKRFVVETVEITDCDTDVSRIAKVITDTKETYSYEDLDEIVDKLNEQQATIQSLKEENEQLRTQLLICQQSKSDDGRFKVWQVPPIKKGMSIISFTTSNGEKDE